MDADGGVPADRRLSEALGQRVDNLIQADGTMTFPAVPAMVDEYTERCVRIFAALGRDFSDGERSHLDTVLRRTLAEAYAFSQRSSVTVAYRSMPAAPLNYAVRVNRVTLEQAYHRWVENRDGPLFGTAPDARVWTIAVDAPDPGAYRVLDIGAGTGRNAVALARRGHPVDAAELTERFAATMRSEAARESLPLRVIQRDVFSGDVYLRDDYSMILLSGVVSEFRTAGQLRVLFELAARHLRVEGVLVFNVFVAQSDYLPDDATRQFAQQSYSSFFTGSEIAGAAAGLPLELDADDSVEEYERAFLPEGQWPHTDWYVNWVTGRDVFGPACPAPPIELRWLVFRRTG